MCVIATYVTGLFESVHTLRSHNGRAWIWVPAVPVAFGLVQCSIETGPKDCKAKLPPTVVNRLPWRNIARQIAPGTTRAEEIKYGVEDGAEGVTAKSAMRSSGWQKLLEAVPVRVREIAGIGNFHASECSSNGHSSFLQNTILDCWKRRGNGRHIRGWQRMPEQAPVVRAERENA